MALVPPILEPWESPKSNVKTNGGIKALLSDCTCTCEWGKALSQSLTQVKKKQRKNNVRGTGELTQAGLLHFEH